MTEMYVHPNGGDTTTGTPGDASSVATATMEKVADEATDLKQQAGEEVGTVVDTAKDQVLTLADEAKSRIKGEADNATTRAAAALSDTASELSTMAASVDDPGPAAQIVKKAGARVDDVAERLRRDGYEGITRDVSRWARQNPGLFLLAAAGTGFVLGRVFRSVDTKGVADAARGTTAPSAVDTPQMQPSAPQYAAAPQYATAPQYPAAPQDTVAGIGSMTPPVQAAPAVAPQPHPEATAPAVPVVDLSDQADPGLPAPGAGFAGGQR
jgi:hypothetical protein